MARVMRLRKDIPATWEVAMEAFLQWKQAGGVSARTVKDYKAHITAFFTRYPEGYASSEALKTGLFSYLSQEVKPATYNLRLIYLRAFIEWGMGQGIFLENPLQGFKRRKDEGRTVNVELQTLRELLRLPDKGSFAGLRDYALMLVTLDTGIRPSEILSLKFENLNLLAREICVPCHLAKTRTSRTLPISDYSVQAITELIRARHPAWDSTGTVFCTNEGTKMAVRAWEDRMKRYSEALGVKIRPYDIRHIYALQFVRNGGNALALQRLLGHTTLLMTKRYVALSQDDLHEQHRLASPLNDLVSGRHRRRSTL